MTKSSALRVAPSAHGVSIWSSDIFGETEASRLRDFLARAFSVQEVDQIELRRAKAFVRIRYRAAANPAQICRKLGRALRSLEGESPGSPDGPSRAIDTRAVYLDGPARSQVHVSRVGASLTTWRVRHQSGNTLHLWHPFLRRRREVVYRLEEQLATILGIEDFRASAVTGRVAIRFDTRALTADRLTIQLEKAWPHLLDGLDGPPSRTRLVAAVGLAGLAVTGQYFAPAVRPIAVAGVTLYSAPNVVAAARDLAHGEIGLAALYTTGLGFMLISGSPLASTVIATLMQCWPHLARRKIVRSQRRLFAGQRRRPAWARVAQADGAEAEVNVDDLRSDDLIVVRSGEIVPADGVVEGGCAAVVDEAPFGANLIEDKSKGDAVWAGAFVRDGSLDIRIRRPGAQNVAEYLSSHLPHGVLQGMPSSFEAERIANRNAKPTLALAAVSLLVMRNRRISQGVIRPDYATAPRLSAQLSALQGVAHGLHQGVLFRNPAALDRLAFADAYVIDESAGADRRQVEVASVRTIPGVTAELLVGYALAAQRGSRSEQSLALAAFASKVAPLHPQPRAIGRRAGVTRYRDVQGSLIELATSQYVEALKLDLPTDLHATPAPRRTAGSRRNGSADHEISQDAALEPLWVLRDGLVIGGVSFARSGEFVGRQVIAALRRQNKRARIVYLSSRGAAETQTIAGELGIELSRSEGHHATSVDVVRGLGNKTIWIGDGSNPNARQVLAASSVSISIAPASRLRDDAADILLPAAGLSGLPDVIDIGLAHAARLRADYRTVYAANLFGVIGAFLARFSALQSGLLSNLGTALIYLRHAKDLDELVSAVEAERASLKRLTPGSLRAHPKRGRPGCT